MINEIMKLDICLFSIAIFSEYLFLFVIFEFYKTIYTDYRNMIFEQYGILSFCAAFLLIFLLNSNQFTSFINSLEIVNKIANYNSFIKNFIFYSKLFSRILIIIFYTLLYIVGIFNLLKLLIKGKEFITDAVNYTIKKIEESEKEENEKIEEKHNDIDKE